MRSRLRHAFELLQASETRSRLVLEAKFVLEPVLKRMLKFAEIRSQNRADDGSLS